MVDPMATPLGAAAFTLVCLAGGVFWCGWKQLLGRQGKPRQQLPQLPFSHPEAFVCFTGSGSQCRDCTVEDERTADGQCITCNAGYYLVIPKHKCEAQATCDQVSIQCSGSKPVKKGGGVKCPGNATTCDEKTCCEAHYYMVASIATLTGCWQKVVDATGDYVTTGSGCVAGVDHMEFDLTCAEAGTTKVILNIIASDGNANSLYIKVDSGANTDWHTGICTSWTDESMDISTSSDSSKLYVSFRESGIKIKEIRLEGACAIQAGDRGHRDPGVMAFCSFVTVVILGVASIALLSARSRIAVPVIVDVQRTQVVEGRGHINAPVASRWFECPVCGDQKQGRIAFLNHFKGMKSQKCQRHQRVTATRSHTDPNAAIVSGVW